MEKYFAMVLGLATSSKMTRRRLFQTVAVAASYLLTKPLISRGVPGMHVNDLNFKVQSDVLDVGPRFRAAIAELVRIGGGRLLISPGVYVFAAWSGKVSPIGNVAKIEIFGYGAEFVFQGLARPLLFDNCSNVTIRGLTLSWARAPFSQGEVEAQSPDRKSADIALDEVTPMDGWSKVEAIGGYDRQSGLMTRRALDAYNVGESIEPLGPRRVRVHFRWPVDLSQTRTLLLRHALYEAHAIEMRRCSDVEIEDVTVVSAPGMAFVGGLCHNVKLSRCVVAPRPGSGLFMSTNADGAHFGDCSGEILIEGCRFSRMGDDGVNVNSGYKRIVERPDNRILVIANRGDAPFRPEDAPPTGDRIEIASSATLEARGEAALAGATMQADAKRERLAFAADLPQGTAPRDVIVDVSQLPKLTVRNCLFEGNRARGVLAHANATIENCVFRDQTLAGVLMSPDLFWMEGPEVAHVRIANNLFDGVDRWGSKQGAISIGAEAEGPDGKPAETPGRPNHDIVIENNTFRNIEGPNVVLKGVR